MFTVFLVTTAAVVSAVMGVLLLRPRRSEAQPLRVPVGAATVAATAVGLVVLGLWMI